MPTSIPRVPGWPLLGNMRQMVTTNIRPFLTQNYQRYGPVFRIGALGHRFVVLAGPEANVLVAREGHRLLRSREAWRPNDRAFGVERSLISVDGEVHRRYRKVEGRAYSRSAFASGMHKALEVIDEDLAGLKSGDLLPVADFCKRVVTEQLARMVVSGSARPDLDALVFFVQTTLMATVTKQLPGVVLRGGRYLRAREQVYAMVDALIARHRVLTPEDTGREPDLIDDLLAAQRDDPEFWAEADLRMAALGAFIAGMDTAANSLAFVLYRLHRHPEYLPAIRAEVDELFAKDAFSASDLAQLGHLHRFVMEVLRLHPIAPALNRTLTEELSFGGHVIPAGTPLILGTTVAHGIDECFPDPERFDPDRFSPGRAEHRRPGAYVPFGVGTHICAGSSMAEGLIMLGAARLLHRLDLELDPAYQLREVARPTPSPDDTLVLRVRRQRHPATALTA